MSLVFEALQSLEAERYGVFRPSPPEAMELLKRVERRTATTAEALPKGPDVDVQAGKLSTLYPVPGPVAASAAVAIPGVAKPVPGITISEVSVAASAAPLAAAAAGFAAPSPVAAAPPRSAPQASAVETKPAVTAPRQAAAKTGRVVAMLSAALPMVRSVLSLVDGKQGAAVARAVAGKPQDLPALAAKTQVDLTAITIGLTALKMQQRELRAQVMEQNATLKQIEGRLEMVREATHRNTMEQKELIEDLRGVGSKVNMAAVVGLSLLAASVAIDLVLYLRIVKVL